MMHLRINHLHKSLFVPALFSVNGPMEPFILILPSLTMFRNIISSSRRKTSSIECVFADNICMLRIPYTLMSVTSISACMSPLS